MPEGQLSDAARPAATSRAALAPLPAERVVGSDPALKEPRWHAGRLFWLEQRPQEQGRTTLLTRGCPGAEPLELTPGEWNLRSRVHDYGGGVYALGEGRGGGGKPEPLLVFVHDGDRCLWRLDLGPASRGGPVAGQVQPAPEPRRLTAPGARAFADGLIDGARRRWIGVMESGGRDRLVAVDLAGGEPVPLHAPADFCGYAVLSPSGRQLAWVEWQQPFMPWERSQLWLGRFEASGALVEARVIAGSGSADPQGVSVFQPLWLPNGDLVVANDRSGWWNLERLAEADQRKVGHTPWQRLLPLEAEFALPQWVYGMATTAWDGEHLVAAACRQGRWELGRLALPEDPGADGLWQPLNLPFDDLGQVVAEEGRLACLASGPTVGQGLLELELATGRWSHCPVAVEVLPAELISPPEPLWFAGYGNAPTHAWYHPPIGGAQPSTPLLVRGHSGPTAMARTGLNPVIPYWTSRGWGVVDVNYGGSTGFGRAYRERLDGQWGVVDVADCAAAALALVAAGKADPERIAIEGGSAAGFTVLAALCFTDVFRAGACRYAVADLTAMATETHRFEARYLDGLVGPWPESQALYLQRSPLEHADRIGCPVIFFQGLNDQVVPPAQTERMAAALRANGIRAEVHLFPEEGHGFRSGGVQRQVLVATEAFFRRQFNLLPLDLPGL
ncbi:prolyl oligopeptidase family serine peptidase [Cyanobium sp. Morenito 9A2]|uniref:S9 family peptidase n=1 Tax=Cyanobium sp. Morenito 9A2 TaxID=2823718 RepID=UPI0020CFA7D3|nr:prolyl oligopeptidase family serine peptidase [Cyanobium sp. Morenito 9A2]MCP9850912.1 S9 family peptidase [Cyanobium sp. Morenito 9A2]